MLSKHSRVCAKHFTEDSFEQNLVVRSLLGPSFKLRQLVLKKDVVPTIFNFTMDRCKPAIGQKTTKNKRIIPAEHRKNSSAISQVKYDLYLDAKPSPRTTHRRRNAAMFKTTMTSQSSLSSIPSIKVGGHFGNVFVRPSAVFVLLTFLLLSRLRKKNCRIKFFLHAFLNILSL